MSKTIRRFDLPTADWYEYSQSNVELKYPSVDCKPMDVYFINDTSDSINWGSQATSKALRSLIEENGGNIKYTEYKKNLKQPQSEQYRHDTSAFLTNFVSTVPKHALNREPKNVYKSLLSIRDVIPRVYAEFDKYAQEALDQEFFTHYLERIQDSDLLVINGEGLMKYSLSRATRANLFLGYLAEEYFDTPCIMTNHTLGIDDSEFQTMVENVYPLLDEVVFREPVSAQKHGHLCGEHTVAADAVFSYEINSTASDLNAMQDATQLNIRPYGTDPIDFEEDYICVAGTSMFAKHSRYNIADYLTLCNELKQHCDQVVLLESANRDSKLMSTISNEFDLPVVGLNTPVDQSISILANASVYVGGRYHPTIFAAKGGTPIIPLSAYTHKLEGLFQLLDVDVTIYDAFDFDRDIETMSRLVDQYLDGSHEFDQLEQRATELGQKAHLNVGPLYDS